MIEMMEKKKSARKILVTGGAGFVGSVCTETLLAAGHEVVVADSLENGRREAVLAPARLVELELCAPAELHQLFRQEAFDAVMHFAALADVTSSVTGPHRFFQNNIIGTLNLLDAMLAHGVRDLVFSSSASVYGEPQAAPIAESHPQNPVNAYGESKLATERMLAWYHRAYGLRSVSLRYFNAAGATARLGEDRARESHLIPCLLDAALGKRSDIAIYGADYPTRDGTCVRDYVHVLDIVSAHLLCLERIEDLQCAAFNVGHGTGYTVREVLQQARQVTGCPIPVRLAAARPGDPATLVASPEKLMTRVGWRPRCDLRQILEDAWAWRRAHPQGYRSAVTSEMSPSAQVPQSLPA
jgi:UDP-glucose 4-epimerase